MSCLRIPSSRSGGHIFGTERFLGSPSARVHVVSILGNGRNKCVSIRSSFYLLNLIVQEVYLQL